MRINARLDEDRTRKLEFLVRETRSTVTGVVRTAIDTYYRQVEEVRHRSAAIFEEVGFIGCAEGDPDLAARHDEFLAEDLGAKHGDR